MLYVFLFFYCFFQKCLSDCIDHFSQTYCKCRQNFESDNADRCRINVQFECKGIRRILTETNFNFKILVHVILMYICSKIQMFQHCPTNFLSVCSCVFHCSIIFSLKWRATLFMSTAMQVYIYLQKHKLKLYEHKSDS